MFANDAMKVDLHVRGVDYSACTDEELGVLHALLKKCAERPDAP
jgi:hypothetical protein